MSLIKKINANRYYRRMLKGLLIVTAVILICIAALHIWFVNNARAVLKQMVHTESKGKLKLDLSELRFELASNKLQIREAVLMSTDSLTQPTTYHVKFRKLTLKVGSFWPLLLQKKLLLDSIKLHDPELTVNQWRTDTVSKIKKDDVSIPQEMGKLYNSILDVLEAFAIQRIIINNAKLSLVNKMKPGTEPVTLSNIYFDLARTAEKGRPRDAFIPDEQTVELRTSDQDIALPGGRHRLAFKNFKLELFRKRIQLDSCTITANTTDSSKSSYTIFFKQLILAGVDFNAMYQHNLIKADSVYCDNPLFDININTLAEGEKREKREQLDPNKIIRELTGDLDLAFIGVKDAGIHINITGRKDRSLFNSNNDDFEMRGLRINGDSSRPVVVQQFDMLVRDYHLYNEDSSASYTFDSIHFSNNKIVLNNFVMQTASIKKGLRGKRDFQIPYFELVGLDWFALIFEQNLVAQEASLLNPKINLTTAGRSFRRKKTNLFESLHSLDDFITLKRLNIVNGDLSMKLGLTTQLNLQKVNLSLNSHDFLLSENNAGLRQAVQKLSFSNGVIKLKNITAQIQNARYTGSELLHADRLSVQSTDGSTKASFQGITIDDLLLDDHAEKVVLDGLHWQKADIFLRPGVKPTDQKGSANMQLRNLSGAHTTFRLQKNKAFIQTYLETIRLHSFSRGGSNAPHLEGLESKGRNLDIKTPAFQLKADSYHIQSDDISRIKGFSFAQIKGNDSVLIRTQEIALAADLNALLSNDIHLRQLKLQQPHITISKRSSNNNPKASFSSSIRINQFLATDPSIKINLYRNDSLSLINIPQNGSIAASGILFNETGLHMDHLSVAASNATFLKTGGEVMGVEKGRADFDLSNIHVSTGGGRPVWNVLINKLVLENPNSMVFGKKRSRLITEQLALGNVALSSESIADFSKLMKFNVSAWLQTATGQLTDSTTTLKWYNAAYHSGSKVLRMDSFSYYPTQPLDSVMKHTPYQTDYITFQSGALQLTDFNLEQYKKDSAIQAHTLTVMQPVITVYRDKAPPVRPGKLKPLPTDLLKNLPLPVHLQHVNLTDGRLSYTEKNAKSGAEGTLILSRLKASLSNIKNNNFNENDSLQLSLTAWLMDTAELNLRIKESYVDTLSGFLMTLRMKPTGLTFMNPVLAPLSNVILKSGTIDSLHLRAIGNNEVAIGVMNMYYHDLKIQLVKGGDETKSSLFGNVASFLANTFIIRKNNTGRPGFVYFERNKQRSFFNYIIRSTFSGMAASIGVKKNSKYKKKYGKLIKEKGLPEIEFE